MNKCKVILATSVVSLSLLVGCTNSNGVTKNELKDDKLKITTTVFPIYDWTRNITKEQDVDIKMLMDNGVDLHSYQPTADDIISINNSDVFIYIGGESDGWVDDVLKQSTNEDLVTINLMEVLGDRVKAEESVAGMEHSHHEHEEEHHEEDGHEHEEEHHEDDEHEHNHNDEHIWLSLKNAVIATEEIAKNLSEITGDDLYMQNATEYITKLDDLDKQYTMEIDEVEDRTLLFGDRFPFRYLTEDYDIDYYAAFSGCSAETEASFETIKFLANKVDELDLPAVIEIEGSSHDIAKTIVSNTTNKDEDILVLNSMQSIGKQNVSEGVDYLSIMEDNLSIIIDALNKEK